MEEALNTPLPRSPSVLGIKPRHPGVSLASDDLSRVPPPHVEPPVREMQIPREAATTKSTNGKEPFDETTVGIHNGRPLSPMASVGRVESINGRTEPMMRYPSSPAAAMNVLHRGGGVNGREEEFGDDVEPMLRYPSSPAAATINISGVGGVGGGGRGGKVGEDEVDDGMMRVVMSEARPPGDRPLPPPSKTAHPSDAPVGMDMLLSRRYETPAISVDYEDNADMGMMDMIESRPAPRRPAEGARPQNSAFPQDNLPFHQMPEFRDADEITAHPGFGMAGGGDGMDGMDGMDEMDGMDDMEEEEEEGVYGKCDGGKGGTPNNNNNTMNMVGSPQYAATSPVLHTSSRKDTSGNKELQNEKEQLLFRLYALRRKGCVPSQRYTMKSNVDAMREEYSILKHSVDMVASRTFSAKMLVMIVTALEFMNERWDPFDLHLDGWSENIHENITDYDEVFDQMYEKYKERMSVSPEVKLMLMLGGSAFMFHMTNSMFASSVPGMSGVTDDVVQKIISSAASTQQKKGGRVAAPHPPVAPVLRSKLSAPSPVRTTTPAPMQAVNNRSAIRMPSHFSPESLDLKTGRRTGGAPKKEEEQQTVRDILLYLDKDPPRSDEGASEAAASVVTTGGTRRRRKKNRNTITMSL